MSLDSVLKRNKEFRNARDLVINGVGAYLKSIDFAKVGVCSYALQSNSTIRRIGFQNLSSGRSLRLLHSIEVDGERISGPFSDSFEARHADKFRPYNFRYHLSEESIQRCIGEFTRYLANEVIPWFNSKDLS